MHATKTTQKKLSQAWKGHPRNDRKNVLEEKGQDMFTINASIFVPEQFINEN